MMDLVCESSVLCVDVDDVVFCERVSPIHRLESLNRTFYLRYMYLSRHTRDSNGE